MYIALDIGGTNIRVAFSSDIRDLAGTIKRHVNVPVTNDYSKDLVSILTAIQKIHEHEPSELHGIGAGLPGVLSEDGSIAVASNITGWVGHNLGADLQKQLGCRVFMENDSTVAAYGEARFGFGQGKNFLYITWGTGFGGAMVEQTDGKKQVRAFEAGHHIIEWNNARQCGCSQKGCAETYIGGSYIQKYHGKSAAELTEQEWDEVLERLAQTLLNTIAYNPASLIVMSGGIAINQKDKLPIIRDKLHSRLTLYPMPDLQVTEYGDDLGLYGAFALLEERLL